VLNCKIEKKRKNSGSKSKGNKYILKEKKKKKYGSKSINIKLEEFNTNFYYIFFLVCGLLIY